MNNIIIILMIMCAILCTIIQMLIQRRIIIYNKQTKEIIAIVGISIISKQILKKDLDVEMKHYKEEFIIGNEKTGKIYLKED